MKKITTAIILLCFSFVVEAQTQEILYFPVKHWIVLPSPGNPIATVQDIKYIPLVMELLNRYFAPANIQFYMSCDPIDTIRNTLLYDSASADGYGSIINSNKKSNTINIYYVNSCGPRFSSGFTSASPSDWMIVKNAPCWMSCEHNPAPDFMTHVHEMGHIFNLYHPHDGFDRPFTAEHPASFPGGIGNMDCERYGDFLCDTPADLHSKYYTTTYFANGYSGNIQDADGCYHCVEGPAFNTGFHISDYFGSYSAIFDDPRDINAVAHLNAADSTWRYKPDIYNIMGYGGVVCYKHFSPMQIDRMRACAENHPSLTPVNPNSAIRLFKSNISSNSFDTLYMYENCSGIIPTIPDTIFYDSCLAKINGDIYICFPLSLTIMETATWYINGDSVRKSTTKNISIGYFFYLSSYDTIWNNPNYKDDYIYVKALLPNGTEINFKFRVSNNREIASIFTDFWKDTDYEILDNQGNFIYA